MERPGRTTRPRLLTLLATPIAFPNACFTITGSPERNKNDRYNYRTGYHIILKNSSQFRYAIGTEQQGQYFEWVAIGY